MRILVIDHELAVPYDLIISVVKINENDITQEGNCIVIRFRDGVQYSSHRLYYPTPKDSDEMFEKIVNEISNGVRIDI